MNVITLDGEHLGFDDLKVPARDPLGLRTRLRLSPAALRRAEGHLADLQLNLLLSHSAGVGAPVRETGLLLALRAHSLARRKGIRIPWERLTFAL